MDELNHDFQALALEGRAMGEVGIQATNNFISTLNDVWFFIHTLYVITAASHRKEILGV